MLTINRYQAIHCLVRMRILSLYSFHCGYCKGCLGIRYWKSLTVLLTSIPHSLLARHPHLYPPSHQLLSSSLDLHGSLPSTVWLEILLCTYKQDNEVIELNKGTKLPYCIFFFIRQTGYFNFTRCPYRVYQWFFKRKVRHLVVIKWVQLESNKVQVLCPFHLKYGGAPFLMKFLKDFL